MGSIMGKYIGAFVALICLAQASSAQDLKPVLHSAVVRTGNGETLDVSAAKLAVKALQPTAQPTRQDLLNFIVIMSLREQRPST
jgi:hypothetical protein